MIFTRKHKGSHARPVRVPLVMQMESLECGAACLTMLLAYWGKWVPLEKVREVCGVSRDGARALNIVKAARTYGLEAHGYRFEPDELVGNVLFPCIIHWNMDHFVILRGFRGDKAYITDPARGAYTVEMDEFDKSFTGIVMTFEPTDDFVADGHKTSVRAFALSRLTGAALVIVMTIALSILATVVGILPPVFSRVFIDHVLNAPTRQWLVPLLCIMAFSAVTTAILGVLRFLFDLKTRLSFTAVASSEYMMHLLKLPIEFFSQRSAGDLIARMRSNNSIALQIVNTLSPIAFNAVTACIYLVVMFLYNVPLAIIGLTCTFVSIVTSQIVARRRRDLLRSNQRLQALESSTSASGFQMMETIKASGAENGFFSRWSGYLANAVNSQIRINYESALLSIPATLASSLANTLVLVLGCWFVIQGDFLLGMVMAFQGFLSQFMSPASQLTVASQTMTEMRAQIERIQDVMNFPEQKAFSQDDSKLATAERLEGHIKFDHVTFGYSPLEDPLIKDFNLEIHPGEHIAFVGDSGCGKSTIAKLLMAILEPWEGTITYDGKTTKDINQTVFFSCLSAVDQEPFLFADTVANNITMWDTTISSKNITQAAKDACINKEIIEREGGYQRQITSNGSDLSGGQRQRLEIARIFAQNPSIIVLDEATSSLDNKTEKMVMEAIRARKATAILVAHRLSTIKHCDRIIVIKDGAIAESGTHEELLELGGAYAQLVEGE